MGFSTKFLLSLLLLAAVPLMVNAYAVWNVGNSAGWSHNRFNYAGWAKRRTFIVGDSLRFVYNPSTTDVLEVTSSAFNSCDTRFPLDTYNTGNDTIPLTEVGDRYFISSNYVDCNHGLKVHIPVSNSSLVIFGPPHDANGYVNVPKPQTTTPTMSPTSTEAGGEAKTPSTSLPPKAPTSSASKFSWNIRLVGAAAALVVALLGFVY